MSPASRPGDREAAIHRRYRNAFRSRLLDRSLLRGHSLILAVLTAGLVTFVEIGALAVPPWGDLVEPVTRLPASFVVSAFLVVWVGGAWMGSEAIHRRGGTVVTGGYALLRALLVGFPYLGIFLLPSVASWDRRSIPGRRWPRRRQAPTASETWWNTSRRRSIRGPLASSFLLLVGPMVLGVSVIWGTALVRSAPLRPWVIALVVALHGAAAIFGARALGPAVGEGRLHPRLRVLVVAMLCIPFLALLALTALIQFEGSEGRSSTLTWKSRSRGGSLFGSASSLGLVAGLQRRWGSSSLWSRPFRSAPGVLGRADGWMAGRGALFSLARLRILLAFFEGYLAGRLLGLLAPGTATTAWRICSWLLLPLAGVGSLIWAMQWLRRLAMSVRWARPRLDLPHGWFAALAPAFLWSGLTAALGLPADPDTGARLLVSVAALLAITGAFRIVFSSSWAQRVQGENLDGIASPVLWAAFFLTAPNLVALAVGIGFEARTAAFWLLDGLALAAPLVAVVVGRTFRPWLVRPFTWGEACARGPGLRWLVGGTVLPMGAFAIPLWLARCARVGRDPRYLLGSTGYRSWMSPPPPGATRRVGTLRLAP